MNPCSQTNHAKHIVVAHGFPFSSTVLPLFRGLCRLVNTYTYFGGYVSNKGRRFSPSSNWIFAKMITLSLEISSARSINSFAKENGGLVITLSNLRPKLWVRKSTPPELNNQTCLHDQSNQLKQFRCLGNNLSAAY